MSIATPPGTVAPEPGSDPLRAPTGVSSELTERIYEKAILIRSVEERLLELFGQGRLFGTVHTCIGQEMTGVAVSEAVQEGDILLSNHRCHGHYLSRTGDVEGLVAEIMGRQTGVCGGRGGSQHICSPGFFSNGVQGGMAPVAAGLALAHKIRGANAICVLFIGDGTLGEGIVYETFNILAKWELAVLIVLENNHYAQSTPQHQTLSGDICARAAAFGIATGRSSTDEPGRLLDDVREAVHCVRSEGRPFFLEIETYRLMAHSKGDDDRDREEIERSRRRDPIKIFSRWRPEDAARLTAGARTRIDAAVERAEAAPLAVAAPDPPVVDGAVRWVKAQIRNPERAVALIHAALQRNMHRDGRIVLLGEDIEGPYGGAFKVTRRLSEEFPGRVRNTPISEAAVVGAGNGLALAGLLPVCEIMFGDFMTLAFDQLLNHASKFRYMYNDQTRTPLVVRSPMGGRRGYGPTHSQSIEKHFLGIPGLTVLALHQRYDPGLVYDAIFQSIDGPVVVIENKLLYGTRVTDAAPAGFVVEYSDEPFPTTRLRPAAVPDVTLICYGGMLGEVERAAETLFDEHEIVCEVICPLCLHPFDSRAVIESVRATGRLLVVEEGSSFAAFGSEAIGQIMENAPGALQKTRRLAAPDHPIPSCGPLEKSILPDAGRVVASVLALMGEH